VIPMLGRYDASYGLMMRGEGDGHFTAVDMGESGIRIDGQVRDLRLLRGANGTRLIVVSRNNDKVEVLRVRAHAQRPTVHP
jgi:enediyne biosynthesis protein E4